jgi:hypothetical protein
MATATQQKATARQRSASVRNGRGHGLLSRPVAAAERAVLIEAGALLRARDSLLDAARTLDTAPADVRARVSSELRASERRGVTARNRLRREVQHQRQRITRTIRRDRRARP